MIMTGSCVLPIEERTTEKCNGVCKCKDGVCKYYYIETQQPNGSCRIMVRFSNHAEYIKFCKQVLKTDWICYEPPNQYILDMEFHTTDDLDGILRKIVWLLQLGFNVYSANWKLATETKPIIERKEEC